MAIEVKANWHRLTSALGDRNSVFVNEAAIAFIRPTASGNSYEIGFISGEAVIVEDDPADFLGRKPIPMLDDLQRARRR